MRVSSLLIVIGTFCAAAILAVVAASFSADLIEETSQRGVTAELEKDGMQWPRVHAEGLQVFITGVAPSEADRFRAISAAGRIVEASRVIDNMLVAATADIAPPRFSIEVLRNDGGLSVIGLIPASSDRSKVIDTLNDIAQGQPVTDLLETADYPEPEGWSRSVSFAVKALKDLPRSKISVDARKVSITAMSDSREERQRLEADLRRKAPPDLQLELAISAPRPVITPFTLRFILDNGDSRFDACSADSVESIERIVAAARKVGLKDPANCIVGLGVPSPRWAEAVEVALDGLSELGGGSVTFSDADIALVALQGTDQTLFDRVVGELEAGLPPVFALHSTLPEPEIEVDEAGREFIATLSPEGLLQLRGRMKNELVRETTHSYAKSRFGSENVYMAARVDDTLGEDWTLRVLAGLNALSFLNNGVLQVSSDMVSVTGKTGNPDAKAEISRILAEKLAQGDQFSIDVTYEEKLDPVASLPTPEECVADISAVLQEHKITFEPGSGTLDPSADQIIDDIALILKECGDIKLEIQGHTDSQGREEMNQALSQTRAQSVLNALHDRRMLVSGFTARGYGESSPIADNETEEGREANRRIEFVLVQPEAAKEAEQDGAATSAETEAEPADPQQERSSDDQN